MRVGVLTGGGDCPGLNAAIRAVVRKAARVYDDEVLGFHDGWRGVLEGRYEPLDVERLRNTLPRGGTILGTSRTDPFRHGGFAQARAVLEELAVEALIVVGGEGTLSATARMAAEGLAVVGIPKTIDNDVAGTDVSIGFTTAVRVATEAIDRLHTTAESHHRVMVVEVMGRHAGWIATYAGIAGGASVILVPEVPFDLDEVCERIRRRHTQGRLASILVVAEGALSNDGSWAVPEHDLDEFGRPRLGGIAAVLAPEIERRTGFETRLTILSHIQRGGTPSAVDRVLASRFGLAALDAVHDGAFGVMIGLQGDHMVRVPLADIAGRVKPVPPDLVADAEVFFS